MVYVPGELHTVSFKDGDESAEDIIKTTGKAAGLDLSADRQIRNPGKWQRTLVYYRYSY